MKLKFNVFFILIIASFAILSCTKEEYFQGENANLVFSEDTVLFDTVFTGIGSATRVFTVSNPNDLPVKITNIKLGKDDISKYRFNINGVSGNEVSDIVIPANDSLFVFVEVNIDPSKDLLIEQDSIIFEANNNSQDIDLVAFGQDVILIKDSVLNSQTWTNAKPYLVYNLMAVDENQILTLEAGTHIYFHRGSSFIVLGTVIANGNVYENVILEGDRLEHDYYDIPGQWDGVWITKLSKDNVMNYTQILNANVGIAVDSINGSNPMLTISNSKIEHHSIYGISAQMSNVLATNCVITNCGIYSVFLSRGGNYSFYHCTIANWWNYTVRNTPAVYLNNYFVYENNVYIYDMESAYFGNCVIWGDQKTEFNFDFYTSGVSHNFKLENCFVKIDTSAHINTSITENFIDNNYKSDPVLKNVKAYDFSLSEISPAIDNGKLSVTELLPALLNLDINALSRISDSAPDVGAYEFIK
jgi:hypothetical protein